ncbi:MAG: hypothetical protein FWG91_03610 [Lachnospiraceae bacterium]|nr:hypothetical protein [Lachnospiraceae bacterium]
MHIAICDDNIAERKQTERLLSRESDMRKASCGVLYVHSYGHEEALLKAPKQYSMFIIDMTKSETDGLKLALVLCKNGITAPIFLCVSKIDYRKAYLSLTKPPQNIYFLDKPIKVAELKKVIDKALFLQSKITPAIELRSKNKTLYLKKNEIIYAICHHYHTDVHLNDGQTVRINNDLFNLYSQLCTYSDFYLLSKKVMVNFDYIDKCSLFRLYLTNGRRFFISPLIAFAVKKRTANTFGVSSP